MQFTAPAKINLSLRVLRRRDDGFHEIESLMLPLSLADSLAIDPRAEPELEFTCDDASLPRDDSNLVVRAAKLFCAQRGIAPALRIDLKKRIPHGAGLGGGSSDAAATLLALDRLFDTRLAIDALSALAAQVGSDVPFFLHRSAAMVRGRGDLVTPCDFPHTLPLLLLKPPFGVPTPWAYERWRDSREVPGVPYAAQSFSWGELVNDLERPVFEKHVFLASLKQWLLAQPEVAGGLLSGSGATVFAVLRTAESADAVAQRARAEFGESLWTAACRTMPSEASRR